MQRFWIVSAILLWVRHLYLVEDSRFALPESVVQTESHNIVGELGIPADSIAEIIRYASTIRSQIEVQILNLPSPVSRKSAFDTATQSPTAPGLRLAECKRS